MNVHHKRHVAKGIKDLGLGRIINGQHAKTGQFPYQVGVYYRRDGGSLYFCGGTLVSAQYVLTAATCASG